MKSPSKSCELDPLPTSLIKENIDIFVPYITDIVNNSLRSGIFPQSQKIAYVRPLIKKPSLDKEILKNYRPISNLKFLGKTIERIVSHRISDHINTFSLSDPYQSAYKHFHGTETALIRVNNDILTSLDNGQITALILLDLSAAFDTVDHSVLLSRLQYYIGIQDLALDWCKSYLTNRPQYVRIGNTTSHATILDYSVPQGSVLGPQWFTIYTYPVRDIILRHNLSYHVYADDTQLYLSFESSQQHAESAIATLELCIIEIRSWMKSNFLKLNDDKTEFLLFGSHQHLSKINTTNICIGNSTIASACQARNLGAIFDSHMTMKSHISNVIRCSALQLRNISRIRKYLSRDATEQIIHSFVTSRLDNNNALLYGLPVNQLYRLQKMQNTAARIITFTRKSAHITPILKELHWLPVTQRIVFKLMLTVYKCVNEIAPVYLSELLENYAPTRTLRSANMQLLQEHKSNRSWGDRSFTIAAPRLWNKLPINIRTAKNITIFKKLLKTHLMSETFCSS